MSTIKIKRSAVAGKVPLDTDLELGELAINTYDGKLFLKKSVAGANTIVDATATNLSFSANSTAVTVASDTGTAAVILGANSTTAGVITTEAQTIAGAKTFTTNTSVSAAGFTTFSIVSTNASTPRLQLLRTGGSGYRITTNTDPDLRFVRLDSTGAEIETPLVINNNGNVGVANNDPQQRLTVAGNISLTGGLVANNSIGDAGQVLTSNGTVSYWSTPAGGSGGATNLTYSANTSTVTIASDTGTDAVILEANSTAAGVITTLAQTIAGAKTFTGLTTISNNNTGALTLNRSIETAFVGLTFANAGVDRWLEYMPNNADGDLVFQARNDDGSALGAVLSLRRATRQVETALDLAVGRNISATGTLSITNTATSNRAIFFQTTGSSRWAVNVAGAESGSNTGSNFVINRYTDAGAFIDSVVSINRASGAMTISGPTIYRRATATDGIILSARNGGTGTFATTITNTALTANNTLTLADGDTTLVPGTMATRGTAIAMAMIFG